MPQASCTVTSSRITCSSATMAACASPISGSRSRASTRSSHPVVRAAVRRATSPGSRGRAAERGERSVFVRRGARPRDRRTRRRRGARRAAGMAQARARASDRGDRARAVRQPRGARRGAPRWTRATAAAPSRPPRCSARRDRWRRGVRVAPARAASCDGSDAAMAAMWNPARTGELHAGFAATRLPIAPAMATRVTGPPRRARHRMAARSCARRAKPRVTGEQTEHQLELRTCVSRRSTPRLGALVDVWTHHPDAAAMEHALDALGNLPAIADCADASRLVPRSPSRAIRSGA